MSDTETPAPYLLPVSCLPGAYVGGALVGYLSGALGCREWFRANGEATGAEMCAVGAVGTGPNGWLFDLSDPLTRCAVARALAVAWGMEPGHTAPIWAWDEQQDSWVLTDGGDDFRWAARPIIIDTDPTEYELAVPGLPDGPSEDAAIVALAMTARALAARADKP